MVEVAAAAAATCWQGSDCRNNAMNFLNTIQKNNLVHKFRSRMKRQVLSSKKEKQRLKEFEQVHKNVSEKKMKTTRHPKNS